MDFSQVIRQIMDTLWYVIPITALASIAKSAWFKGVTGQFLVNLKTRLFLDKGNYHLIRNVMLPTRDGSTQIDHIIISIYGVFVVETKNFQGWIFGGKNQKTWTQKIYKHKNTFQNSVTTQRVLSKSGNRSDQP